MTWADMCNYKVWRGGELNVMGCTECKGDAYATAYGMCHRCYMVFYIANPHDKRCYMVAPHYIYDSDKWMRDQVAEALMDA
jgi:hypothetical protein